MKKTQAGYIERAACPVYTAIAAIEGRWKPMLYQRLTTRALGFGELQRAIPGVSRKVLREQLRQLEADGVIVRRALQPARLGVRYELTPHGRALEAVFAALWKWGTRHLARPNAAGGSVAFPPGRAVFREA
jgi:DNA-binding HxlR family transcriptional regulator